jgi:hypothetical protein
VSEDARVQGKERGTDIERRVTSWSSELAWRTVGTCGRRRGIPRRPVNVFEGEQREIREEGLGYL